MEIKFEEIEKSRLITDQIKRENIEAQEKKQVFFRIDNSNPRHCLSLCYNYVAQSDNLDRAFDLLFEEIEKNEQINNDKNN
jgi:hypothetical protein